MRFLLSRVGIVWRPRGKAADMAIFVPLDLTDAAQMSGQATARALEARLSPRDGEPMKLRVLSLSHPFKITALEDVSVLFAEFLERSGQTDGQSVDLGRWFERLAGERDLGRLTQWQLRSLEPMMIDEHMARRRKKPGARALNLAEAGPLLKGFEEDNL